MESDPEVKFNLAYKYMCNVLLPTWALELHLKFIFILNKIKHYDHKSMHIGHNENKNVLQNGTKQPQIDTKLQK